MDEKRARTTTKDDVASIIAAQVTQYHEKPCIVFRIWCEDPCEPRIIGKAAYVIYDPNVKEGTFSDDFISNHFNVDMRFDVMNDSDEHASSNFRLFPTPIYNCAAMEPSRDVSKYTKVLITGPFSKNNQGFGPEGINRIIVDPVLELFLFEHNSLKWTWTPQLPRPDV